MAECLVRLIVVLMAVVSLVTVGCRKAGPIRGSIHGEVKLDGQLLQQGSILFVPIDGTRGVVTGEQIVGGKYHLRRAVGPSIGRNRVEIRAVRKGDALVPAPFAPEGEMIPETVEAVATRFNSESTLKVSVLPGDNIAHFEVHSK